MPTRQKTRICVFGFIVLIFTAVAWAAPVPVTLTNASPVYRFNTLEGGYFYTIDEAEKNATIQNYRYRYEGIGFYAFPTRQTVTLPVYRFSTLEGGYLYTIDEAEKNAVIQDSRFRYEGIGFYAFPTGQAETLPVYRFNTLEGGYLYTIDEAEKNAVIQESRFRYEGIGFYAYLTPTPIPTPTPTPTPGLKLIINQIDTTSCLEVKSTVTVTDMAGNPVTGLTVPNFIVTEDSINQSPITVKPVSGQIYSPMAVALTMDYSGSMSGQPVIDVQNAAAVFFNQMGSGDQGEIIKFSTSVSVVQPFTTNKTLLASVANSSWPGAGRSTALYDSIYQAVADTVRQGGRMAVIAMTDGIENASSHGLDEIINFAKKSGVPVFTIGLGSVEENVLKRIASEC
jgi:von Willebrand factor type A domain/Repeat of unknown function (DUF5648)